MRSSQTDLWALKGSIRKGEVGCSQLMGHFFGRIDEGKFLNAFISVFEDKAHQRAGAIDEKAKNGSLEHPIGMVLGVEDDIVLKGERTRCGSRFLEDLVAP